MVTLHKTVQMEALKPWNGRYELNEWDEDVELDYQPTIDEVIEYCTDLSPSGGYSDWQDREKWNNGQKAAIATFIKESGIPEGDVVEWFEENDGFIAWLNDRYKDGEL